MRSRLRFRVAPFVQAACAVALIGCVSVAAPKQPFQDPARALSLQSLTRERVQSIRAEARIDQRGKEGRIKGTVLMLVERPGSVRFDAMTQFGPAAVLTSNGEQFSYADLRSKRFLSRDLEDVRDVPKFLGLLGQGFDHFGVGMAQEIGRAHV